MRIPGWARLAVPTAALVLVLAQRLLWPQLAGDTTLRVFDVYQRIQPRAYEPVPVRVVDLDDESLERIGQWPWPRTKVAELVERMGALGAAAIAFDIVFAEPDRTSPSRVLPLWGSLVPGSDVDELAARLPDHDDVLAATIARHPVVTGFVATPEPGGRLPLARHGIAHAGDDPRLFLPAYQGAVVNLPQLEQAAHGNGSFAIAKDRDGLIRRVPLLYQIGEDLYPSLAAEALRVALDSSTYVVRASGSSGETSFGAATGITEVKLAPGVVVPTDSQGRIWIHGTLTVPERLVPAWQVLEGEVDPTLLQGHIVFVGTSAAGLADLRATPLHPALPGVEVHAQVIEQIMLGHYLKRPDWALGAELMMATFWGVLLVLLIRRAGPLWSAGVGLLGVAGAIGGSWLAFDEWHMLLDPVQPAFAGIAVYLSGSLTNYLSAESERRQVRTAFSHYLTPALVEQLAANPGRLRLGGETRELSVLFADIRGFTTISERLEASVLTSVLNEFLTPMTEIILERSGTIDKYIGDCIMAFWNAPLDDPRHASNACAAALAMEAKLGPINLHLRERAEKEGYSHVPLRLGIGINTGSCCVGNMGSAQRFDYSAIGDEVNLASRLEGQSKIYGTTIVIGDKTRRAAPEFAALELDCIRVKGRSQPEHIHVLLGGPEKAAEESFIELTRQHEAMLKAYREQDWDRATELCFECGDVEPRLGGLYQLYQQRIRRYRAEELPDDWDGVQTAKTK